MKNITNYRLNALLHFFFFFICVTTASAQTGTTYGCYIASPPHILTSPGDVRIVSSVSDCIVGETAISWEVFPVGTSPAAVTFDGSNIWVSNQSANTITKLRASDGANLGTFSAGPNPGKSVFDGENIWITNYTSNTLTKLRASDGVLIATIPFRGNPSPYGIAFDGTYMWVSCFSDNSLSKLRLSDGAELSNTPGVTRPVEILIEGSNIWITNNLAGGTMTKINKSTGAILDIFSINGGFPGNVAFDGSNIWTLNSGTRTISKIRSSDSAVIGGFPMGIDPAGIAFDGTNMWVANQDVVLKYRASDGALLSSFPGSFNGGGGYETGVAFDGTYVWVSNRTTNTVTRYHDLGEVLPPPAELVSWYKTDGNVNDSVGANNPSATNAISFEAGKVCQGVRLSSSVGYLEVPDSPSLRNQRFSVSAWVKPDGAGPNNDLPGNTFIQKGLQPPAGDLGRTMSMWWSAQDNRFRFGVGNSDIIASANTFPAGQFYNVTGTYDGSKLSLYVNGNLEAQISLVTTIPYDAAVPWTIGSSYSYYRSIGYPRTWNGVIDEVKIYNGALSANEAQQLFTSNETRQCPLMDTLAPISSSSVSQQPNSAGWNDSDVTISLSSSDNTNGSGVKEIIYSASGAQMIAPTIVNGASTNLTITAEGETVITYFARDNAGNTEAAQTLIIKIDKTVPSISCGTADGTWHSADVSIACTSTENISSLANSADANFNLTTNVPADTETSNAATGSREVCDVAENCAPSGSVGGNKVDKKAPAITITSPTNGNYLLNQTVAVNYTCADGGSGVANCTGTTSNGGQLDTSSVGAKTFTVNAADNVGNNASPATVNYTVGFGIQVLFDQTKAHKAGSTVPIKIRLVDANGLNVSSAETVVHAVSVIQTGSSASTVVEDSGNSNPDFDFRYDQSLGGYIFNLKTKGYGTGTYQLNFIAGNNPTVYSVQFQVRQ